MAGITLTIDVDDKGTVKVKQFADESKKAFQQMTDGPKVAQGPLASLQESWVGLTTKIAAATAVVYGIGKVFSSFVNEAAEAEQIENRLRFALETTGYTWQYAKSAVDEFANSVQASTRFSDEQARRALTDMMMYTREFAKAQMGAKLAMDMSIRTGQDLGSTSRLIGMAMSGNVEMLGRYIPELRILKDRLGENATVAQLWNETLKILQQKFGGTAQADVKSYSGTLAQFKNAWSDTKESIGNLLLGPAAKILTWLSEGAKGAKAFADELGKLNDQLLKGQEQSLEDQIRKLSARRETLRAGPSGGVFQLFGYDREKEIAAIGRDIEILTEQKENLRATAAKKLAGETKKDDLRSPFERLYGMTESELKDRLSTSNLLYQGWLEERTREGDLFLADQQTLMDSLLATRTGAEFTFPTEDILPDLLQIANEEGEILTLTKEQYQIRKYMNLEAAELLATTRMLKEATGAEFTYPTEDILSEWTTHPKTGKPVLVEQWKNEVNQMANIFNTFSNNISSVWSENVTGIIKGTTTIKGAFKNMATGMADAFISAVTKMIASWVLFGNTTGGGFGAGVSKTASGGTGWLGVLGTVGKWLGLQEGGIINRPTPAIVGESGPEAVIPLKGGKIPIEGGGRTIVYVTNNYNKIDAVDAPSFFNIVKRFPGATLSVIEDDAKGPGTMRNVFNKMF